MGLNIGNAFHVLTGGGGVGNAVNSLFASPSPQQISSHFSQPSQQAQVVADPPPPVPGQSYSSSGGGTAPSAAQAQNQAWWGSQNSALDDQINRLDGQKGTGIDNINRSYQAAYDTLMNGQNDAQRQYGDTTNKTINDNIQARDQINTGVRNGLNGLQRLLGAHGAGNSSAASVLAPYAAGLAGNQQTSQVQKSYADNRQTLDDNWNHTKEDYRTKFGTLSADRQNRENSLLQNLANIRAGLLNSKQQLIAQQGGAPNADFANQIHNLGIQSDQLGAVQTFDPGHVDYKTPDLAQYAYSRTAAPTVDPNQAGADQNLGAFQNLLGTKDKKQTGALA